jgi:putative transposase
MTYAAALRGRHSVPGFHYVVTAVTAHRISLFWSFEFAVIVARELHQLQRDNCCQMIAWVIMPDHLHALVVLDRMPLSRLMQRLKGRTAMAINRRRNSRDRVWQRGFHDHALRREESIVVAARYVVTNPLRAGLVRRLGEYSFWDQSLVEMPGESSREAVSIPHV